MAETVFSKPVDEEIAAINSQITNLIKSDTYTGTTTAAGILYAGVPRNRIIVFADCPSNSIINLDYPVGNTNFIVYSTDGTKLTPVTNTSVTVKYWYYEISGSI